MNTSDKINNLIVSNDALEQALLLNEVLSTIEAENQPVQPESDPVAYEPAYEPRFTL